MAGRQQRAQSTEVEEIAARIRRVLRAAGPRRDLLVYHQVGEIVGTVETSYGGHHLIELSKVLKEVTGMGLSTLYKAKAFAEGITRDQAKALDQHKVSWRAAARLASTNLHHSTRFALIRQICSREIESEDLGTVIRERLKSSATANTRSIQKAEERALKAIRLIVSARKNRSSTPKIKQRADAALLGIKREAQRK